MLNILMTTFIEYILNHFIWKKSKILRLPAYYQMLDKTLRMSFRDYPLFLTLTFSKNKLEVSYVWEDDVNCAVILNKASVLFKILNSTQNFSSFIWSNHLKIQGDIKVLKNFIDLFLLTESNFDDILDKFLPQYVKNLLYICKKSLESYSEYKRQYVSILLVDTLKVLPSIAEWHDSQRNLNNLNRQLDSLIKKMSVLEIR